jgi:hypothetical protein
MCKQETERKIEGSGCEGERGMKENPGKEINMGDSDSVDYLDFYRFCFKIESSIPRKRIPEKQMTIDLKLFVILEVGI